MIYEFINVISTVSLLTQKTVTDRSLFSDPPPTSLINSVTLFTLVYWTSRLGKSLWYYTL